ncbi:hypothetical protein GEMRC1_005437 [Eukaryota sp. GEM-RC1]
MLINLCRSSIGRKDVKIEHRKDFEKKNIQGKKDLYLQLNRIEQKNRGASLRASHVDQEKVTCSTLRRGHELLSLIQLSRTSYLCPLLYAVAPVYSLLHFSISSQQRIDDLIYRPILLRQLSGVYVTRYQK